MFRKLVPIVAGVTFVLGMFTLPYAAWDGTSMARPAGAGVPAAGTSITPVQSPAAARTVHPAIGETPTFLEARRVISPWLELELVPRDA